jgi:hypothetical protein
VIAARPSGGHIKPEERNYYTNGHGTDTLYVRDGHTITRLQLFYRKSRMSRLQITTKPSTTSQEKCCLPKNPNEAKWWEVKALSKVLEANISEEFESPMRQRGFLRSTSAHG